VGGGERDVGGRERAVLGVVDDALELGEDRGARDAGWEQAHEQDKAEDYESNGSEVRASG
jgi:hypothetical protein